jgi:hypothetical protein
MLAQPPAIDREPGRAGLRLSWTRAGWALGWGLLFFACLQLGLAVVMERWRPELRDLEYGAKRARFRARRRENPGRPLLLVLGSSRTNLGFRPDALPDLPAVAPPRGGPARPPLVFNCSLMGAGPVLELLSLRRLLDDGVRPDWVLLESWPPYFNQEGERAEWVRIPVTRLAWSDLGGLRRYHPRPDLLYESWCLARLAPWSSSRFQLLTRCARDWLPREPRRDDLWNNINPWGWLPYHGSMEPAAVRQRAAHVRETFQPILRDYHISAVSDRALREALTLCRQQGIRVALLFMPETSEFRSWYPPAVRAESDRYLRALSAEYGAPLIDAHDWVPDADFGDGYHLLPRGAAAFTRRCGQEELPRFLRGEGQTGQAGGGASPAAR